MTTAGTTAGTDGSPTPLLVLDVVGLTPASWTTCRTSRPSDGPAPTHRSAPCSPP